MEIFFVYKRAVANGFFSYKIKVYNIPVPINLNLNTTQNIFVIVLTDVTDLYYQQDQNTHFVYE